MSRYVDIEGDWVDDAIKEYSLGYYEDDEYAIPIARFDSAPSIDIVRCKECVKRMREDCPMCNGCKLDRMPTEDDDFCSYGEREGE